MGEGWPTRGTNYAGADDPRYPMAEGRPPAAAGEIAIDAIPPSAPATGSATRSGCP